MDSPGTSAPLFRSPMIRDEHLLRLCGCGPSPAVLRATKDLINWLLKPGCCSSYGDCSTGMAAVAEKTLASVATAE